MQVNPKKAWASVGEAFCRVLAPALAQACTSEWKVGMADEPFSPRPEDDAAVSFRIRFAGALEGEVYLLMKKAEVVTLGLRGGEAEAAESGHEAGLRTMLQGCLAPLGEHLGEHGAVTAEMEMVHRPELPEGHELELWIHGLDGATRVSFHLCLDRPIVTSLQTASAQTFSYPAATPEASAANLDMVLDVELNVTLRFGQRQLPLREVLELTSGSVVELDRQVDEPVELILDGRVVARGEAVVIDGNYGMRITQVMKSQMV